MADDKWGQLSDREKRFRLSEKRQERAEKRLSEPAGSLGEAIKRVPSQMGRNFADRVSQEFGTLGSATVAAIRTPGARTAAFTREVSRGVRGAIADALGGGQIGRYLGDKIRSGIRYDKDPQKNFERLRAGLVAASQDFQQIKGTISSVNKQTRELALVVKQVAEKVNRIEREQSVQQRLIDQLKQAADENKGRVSGLKAPTTSNKPKQDSSSSLAKTAADLTAAAAGGVVAGGAVAALSRLKRLITKFGIRRSIAILSRKMGARLATSLVAKLMVGAVGGAVTGGIVAAIMVAWTLKDINDAINALEEADREGDDGEEQEKLQRLIEKEERQRRQDALTGRNRLRDKYRNLTQSGRLPTTQTSRTSSVTLAERYARMGTNMEKQQFLAYGQLPRGFENVPGHMGILGSPGAVMARGAMPLGQFGGGGTVGGYGGMPSATGGGGYSGGYQPAPSGGSTSYGGGSTPAASPSGVTAPPAAQLGTFANGAPKGARLALPVTGTIGGQPGDPRPYRGGTHSQAAIDIGAKTGTPIYSPGNGKVIKSSVSRSHAGNLLNIEVQADDGRIYELRNYHLQGWGEGLTPKEVAAAVKAGKPIQIKKGQVIGYVGGTGVGGKQAFTPHLHIETHAVNYDKQGRRTTSKVNPNQAFGIGGSSRGKKSVAGGYYVDGKLVVPETRAAPGVTSTSTATGAAAVTGQPTSPAGANRSIVSGPQQAPEQTPGKPADPTPRGNEKRVNPQKFFAYTSWLVKDMGLVGKVPPDGAKYGIRKGTAEEWSRFWYAMVLKESGGMAPPRDANGNVLPYKTTPRSEWYGPTRSLGFLQQNPDSHKGFIPGDLPAELKSTINRFKNVGILTKGIDRTMRPAGFGTPGALYGRMREAWQPKWDVTPSASATPTSKQPQQPSSMVFTTGSNSQQQTIKEIQKKHGKDVPILAQEDTAGIVKSLQEGKMVQLFSGAANRVDAIKKQLKDSGLSDDQVKQMMRSQLRVVEPFGTGLARHLKDGYIDPNNVFVGKNAATGSGLLEHGVQRSGAASHLEAAAISPQATAETRQPAASMQAEGMKLAFPMPGSESAASFTDQASVTLRYANQNAKRHYGVTTNIERKLKETAAAVYGPGTVAEIYSGGQLKPFATGSGWTSTRHNIDKNKLGRAADVRFYDKNGKLLDGSFAAQYWAAKKFGGVGATMAGGGVHLDEHTDRASHWFYRNTPQQARNRVLAGVQGQLPKLVEPVVAENAQSPGTVVPMEKIKVGSQPDVGKGTFESPIIINKGTSVQFNEPTTLNKNVQSTDSEIMAEFRRQYPNGSPLQFESWLSKYNQWTNYPANISPSVYNYALDRTKQATLQDEARSLAGKGPRDKQPDTWLSMFANNFPNATSNRLSSFASPLTRQALQPKIPSVSGLSDDSIKRMFETAGSELAPKTQEQASFLEANVTPEQPKLPELPSGLPYPSSINPAIPEQTLPEVSERPTIAGTSIPDSASAELSKKLDGAASTSPQASTAASAGSDGSGGGGGSGGAPGFRNHPESQAASPGSQGLGSFGRCWL